MGMKTTSVDKKDKSINEYEQFIGSTSQTNKHKSQFSRDSPSLHNFTCVKNTFGVPNLLKHSLLGDKSGLKRL